MPSPLQPGDPPLLGVFRLMARLDERPAGIVYLGVDPQGRELSIAVLHRATATDAAARDRFGAAIVRGDGVEWVPPEVVAAEPDGPTPWVATPYAEGAAGAAVFLDPVAVAGPGPEAYGPQFQHYWAGDQVPAAPPPGWGVTPGLPGDSSAVSRQGVRWTLVGGVVALGVLLVTLAVLLVPLMNSGRPRAASSGGPTTPSPSNVPSSSAKPTVTASPRGKPPLSRAKVKGPVWKRGDDTYTMRLPKIGLVFRTPPKWGCMRSEEAKAPNIRWTCVDEGGEMSGAGLTVEVRPCPSGCPAPVREAARKEVSPRGNWKSSDASTSYSEWVDGGAQKMLTLHFYHQDNERSGVNAQVVVLGVAGGKGQADTVWKMLNDLRAGTP